MGLMEFGDSKDKSSQMNDIRAYHASGVQGGKSWYRFLCKVLINANDIVGIASEAQGDRKCGDVASSGVFILIDNGIWNKGRVSICRGESAWHEILNVTGAVDSLIPISYTRGSETSMPCRWILSSYRVQN